MQSTISIKRVRALEVTWVRSLGTTYFGKPLTWESQYCDPWEGFVAGVKNGGNSSAEEEWGWDQIADKVPTGEC